MTGMLRKALVATLLLGGLPIAPAHAGFSWSPPPAPTEVPTVPNAPTTPVEPVGPLAPMPSVESAPISEGSVSSIPQQQPMAMAAAPMAPAIPPAPAEMSPAVRDALRDVMAPAPASAPVAVATPAPTRSAPTTTASVAPRPLGPASLPQDRKHAIYPPPRNAPAAPLPGARLNTEPPQPVLVEPKPASAAPMLVPPVDDLGSAPTTPSATSVMVEPAPQPASEPAISGPASVAPAVPVPATPAIIDGFGKNVPLSLAIEQVVPKNYKVVYEAQPDMNMIVSWSGGRPWNKVLEDMLYAHGYRVVIVDGVEVRIVRAGAQIRAVPVSPAGNIPVAVATPAPIAAVPITPVAPASQPNLPPRPPAGAASNISPRVSADAPPPPVQAEENKVLTAAPLPADVVAMTQQRFDSEKVAIFSGHAGDSLRDVLDRWCSQSGVQLYWQADRNFVLGAPLAFNTTFPRAVEQLLNVYADQANRPVATLHPNAPQGPAVLKITNAP